MTFYSEMAVVASDLLAEFGQAVTITRTSGEVINKVTGVTFPGVETTYTPNGILKPYNENLVDGTRILKTDFELILDDTVKPLTSDAITIDSEEFKIVGNVDINPGGTPLVYKVQVRR